MQIVISVNHGVAQVTLFLCSCNIYGTVIHLTGIPIWRIFRIKIIYYLLIFMYRWYNINYNLLVIIKNFKYCGLILRSVNNIMKKTIESLFRLPSMTNSYVAAGGKGMSREITRIDILETPYPEVEKFLEPNKFIFTTFWNSKNDKDARIKLVESMIFNKCAGIGIMPDNNLNGIIDSEILRLGNEYSFPVIFIDRSVRWSDIIKEFYHNPNINNKIGNLDFSKLLFSIERFNNCKDIKILTDELALLLQLPTIIMIKNNFCISEFRSNEYVTEKVISKINIVKSSGNYPYNSGIVIYYDKLQYILAFYGTNSVFATIIDKDQLDGLKENLYYGIAPFIVSHIDKLQEESQKKYPVKTIDNNEKYYFFFIRKENIHKIVSSLKNKYAIYRINEDKNYIVCLIDSENLERGNIYSEYSRIIDSTGPECFVFSDLAFNLDSIGTFTDTVNLLINDLFFLKGIYTFSEISIIYMLTITPYSYRSSIYSHYSRLLGEERDPIFLETLRLFIVLKSINNVSELLNVHTNTVKYRILKAINPDMFYTTNITTDVWNLDLLIPLEMLNVED